MTHTIFSRADELKILESFYSSARPEFLAIYGRRRVGKTFLINEFFKDKKNTLFLKITGLKKGLMREQIRNFIQQVGDVFHGGASLTIPKNWNDAFITLHNAIKQTPKDKKIILFFDELPWMVTRNSRLLETLEYQWNQHWSDDDRIKFIACGSSSSWIVKKLIKSRGGFHNRVTKKIHLSPFTLSETNDFLIQNKIKLNHAQILSIYMAIGGIPFYLMQIKKGLSSTEIIEDLAFSQDSFLLTEFDNLFSSLFDHYEDYIAILKIIATTHYGISQEKVLNQLDPSLQGARGLAILNELEESDFIMGFKPHFHKKRGIYYRVIDEYTLFYFKWIEPIKNTLHEHSLTEGNWQDIQNSAEWHAWAGYAFESICYKHISQIRKALKISPAAIADTWRYVPRKKEKNEGAQIDLLFDRKDNAITLCEIKYNNKPLMITKQLVNDLLQKETVLKKQTGTKKQLFWSLISANGIQNNFYSEDVISGVVTLDDFFD
ncbi:MAG: hypothetical protein A3E82_08460 [Gammaproteobacteria bacterium RIFCSPHIGHO2_12_FULL_38_11]|nr:MAG: hypothetical protein A3E82_08460 [Gammaproteobacteria bacterium RIFCSPHIGHO2_12_FULL_38_11]